MLISSHGTLVRTRVAEIAQVGRNTQGVTLIRLPADETLVGVAKVEALPDELTDHDSSLTGNGDAEIA